MIKDLIKEVLEESKQNFSNIDQAVEDVYSNVKNFAKDNVSMDKIGNLKDFLFDKPNAENDQLKEKLKVELNKTIGDTEEFINKFKEKIDAKLKEKGLEKDLSGILTLFDLGYLSGFLKMFKF